MLLDNYWPLVYGIHLVSTRSLLSSYLLQLLYCFCLFVLFFWFTLLSHASTGWYLWWGHMALMCRYD